MLLYPILFAALLGACWAEEDGGHSFGGGRLGGIAEPRLAVNAMRIHQLEEHIEKLKERIEEAKHVDPERFLHEIDARVGSIEGNHCAKKEFQCGSNDQECISDLFMCDGHKDCHNGHDEDEEVCSTEPVKAGNIFTGIVHWTDCTLWPDHLAHLTITSTKRFKFFPARVVVQGILSSIYKVDGEEQTTKVKVHGGYNFGNRRLVLFPDDDEEETGRFERIHGIGLKCEFSLGDNERAECTLVTEASLHECAEVHFHLETHGDVDHH